MDRPLGLICKITARQIYKQALVTAVLQNLFPGDKIIRAETIDSAGNHVVHPGAFFIIPQKYTDEVSVVQRCWEGETLTVSERNCNAGRFDLFRRCNTAKVNGTTTRAFQTGATAPA